MNQILELCARLTERGVEYTEKLNGRMVEWDVDGAKWCAYEEGDQLRLWMAGSVAIEPAKAVAATLGPGTCHLEEIEKDCDTASEYMLDREWCFDAVYMCSCGCRFGHVAHNRPHYCPNCGAKVVDAEVDG